MYNVLPLMHKIGKSVILLGKSEKEQNKIEMQPFMIYILILSQSSKHLIFILLV